MASQPCPQLLLGGAGCHQHDGDDHDDHDDDDDDDRDDDDLLLIIIS